MESVERTVTLPTDLAEAWDLVTRPEDLEGWLGREVVLDPTAGGAGLVVDHDGTRRHVVVDEVVDGERLSWRWWVDGDEGSTSRVDVTLRPSLDGTVVTVVERPVAPAGARASARPTGGARLGAEAWSHRLLHLEALLLVAAVRT